MIIVERARSNRSLCNICFKLIDRDIWRIGTGRHRSREWHHLDCFMTSYGEQFMRDLIPVLSDDQLRAIGLEVEHVTPEPDPEPERHAFIVGDRIRPRVVGSECAVGGTYGDWVGEITEYPHHSRGSDFARVQWDGPRAIWGVRIDEIEHIESEPEPEPEEPLTEGDRVRVRPTMVGSNCQYGGPFGAWTGEITRINAEGSLQIRWDRPPPSPHARVWCVSPDEVERV